MSERETNTQREARVQEVLAECIRRRVRGEGLTDQQILTEHTDLLPELGEGLRKLALIEAAERRIGSSACGTDGKFEATRPPDDSIPGYEIVDEIHRGGQGVVYRAVQQSTKRTVAIKVMHEGPFASYSDRARFEREIQILGRFNHSSIVTIHDSGEASGSVFFVMDYIDGAPLDIYIAKAKPSVIEVLELFVKICDAVNAAHLRGVIHRDLKPSNIRVDPDGVPYVLDFGLAKISPYEPVAEKQSEAITTTGQFIGSLPWASPEQAAGNPDQIDVRTDVYSLGLILYRMLTGQFPYRINGTMREVIDHILTVNPVRLRSLRPDLDHEVETIVSKCLAKECERRYQSAGELARDIRRHLAGEPIEAMRDSVGYLVRKQFLRYKVPVTVAVLFVMLITAGFVTSLLFWREAVRGQEEAKRQAAIAEAVADFLNEDLFAAADPWSTSNRQITVKEALDTAAQAIDDRFEEEPLVEASIRGMLGRTYRNLGEYDLSEVQLARAMALRHDQLDEDHPDLLSSISDLAELYRHQSRYDEAESLLVTALAQSRLVLGNQHRDTLVRMNDLGLVYRDQGRYAEARELLSEAFEAFQKILGPRDKNTLAAMTNLAKVHRNLGDFDESETLYLKVIDGAEAEFGMDHPLTLATQASLAALYADQRRPEESAKVASEVLKRYRRTFGEEHAYTLRVMHQLASSYRDLRRYDQAELLLQEAFIKQRSVLGDEHADTLTTLSTLGLLYLETGRPAEAEARLLEALEHKRRALGSDHPSTLMSMHYLGVLRRDQGQHVESEALFAEILSARRRLLGNSHPYTLAAMGYLAAARAKLKQYAEAKDVASELVTRLKNQSPPARPALLARALHLLADILMNLKNEEEAEPILRESLELRRNALPDHDPAIAMTQGALGECLTTLGRYEEAESLLLESYSRLTQQGNEKTKQVTRERIYALYEAWGDSQRAAEWRAASSSTNDD